MATTGSVTGDRAVGPLLAAIVLVVVAPSACIIWFMTEAAGNEAAAARLRLSEARRGQLRLLRDRIDTGWQSRLTALRDLPDGGARTFHHAIVAGMVDSIIVGGQEGPFRYPLRAAAPASADDLTSDPDWRAAATRESSGDYREAARMYAVLAARTGDGTRAARAAQAHVRALVQAGDTDGALRAIERYFSSGPLAAVHDAQGRLIAADAQLLALQLLPPGESRITDTIARLARLLNDYEGTVVPSTQRLFLMAELVLIAGSEVELPTYPAERLAAEFLQADGIAPSGEALEATGLHDVWKVRVPGTSSIALFRTETIAAMAAGAFETQSDASARLAFVPPGGDAGMEAMTVSPLLPGWLVGFTPSDVEHAETLAGRRMTIYLWSGSLAVAGLALAGLLFWQAFRRQSRLSRLKTDLVAAVSHELKTPLASMRALVDLMLDDPAIDRARLHEYLQMIAGENERLSRLIEHFLTFSRIDRRAQYLVFRDVQPAALVSQAIAVAPGRERFPGLVSAVAPGLPPLYGDEDALVTVLLNLLENAYKYSGENRRVSLRVREDAGRVVFEVEDNGIGISRRDRRRIFRPFYQVDQRLARERGGCGLGLSIVEFIVRAHGGEVTVHSEPGVGSAFVVTLPSRATAREAVA